MSYRGVSPCYHGDKTGKCRQCWREASPVLTVGDSSGPPSLRTFAVRVHRPDGVRTFVHQRKDVAEIVARLLRNLYPTTVKPIAWQP